MASGFGGRYQGSVVDDADPLDEHRLLVIVPEVWAPRPGRGPDHRSRREARPPRRSATSWVTFEGGDTDYPIWVGVA
jgi:hypothetical protein